MAHARNWGGKRKPKDGKAIGRPKTKIETPEIPTKGFASDVLALIGTTIERKDGTKIPWIEMTRDKATNAAEYQLSLLVCGDRGTESANFNKLLDRKYGKPAQGVFVGDTREAPRPELDFGDLPIPYQPRPADKPN
jgi:hypothetical protein